MNMDQELLEGLVAQSSPGMQLLNHTVGADHTFKQLKKVIATELTMESRWRWSPATGLEVTVAQDAGISWVAKDPLCDLENRVRPATLSNGDPDPNSHRALTEQGYVWLAGQLLHYGLDYTPSRTDALASLAKALLRGSLKQPERLARLSRKLRLEYELQQASENTTPQFPKANDQGFPMDAERPGVLAGFATPDTAGVLESQLRAKIKGKQRAIPPPITKPSCGSRDADTDNGDETITSNQDHVTIHVKSIPEKHVIDNEQEKSPTTIEQLSFDPLSSATLPGATGQRDTPSNPLTSDEPSSSHSIVPMDMSTPIKSKPTQSVVAVATTSISPKETQAESPYVLGEGVVGGIFKRLRQPLSLSQWLFTTRETPQRPQQHDAKPEGKNEVLLDLAPLRTHDDCLPDQGPKAQEKTALKRRPTFSRRSESPSSHDRSVFSIPPSESPSAMSAGFRQCLPEASTRRQSRKTAVPQRKAQPSKPNKVIKAEAPQRSPTPPSVSDRGSVTGAKSGRSKNEPNQKIKPSTGKSSASRQQLISLDGPTDAQIQAIEAIRVASDNESTSPTVPGTRRNKVDSPACPSFATAGGVTPESESLASSEVNVSEHVTDVPNCHDLISLASSSPASPDRPSATCVTKGAPKTQPLLGTAAYTNMTIIKLEEAARLARAKFGFAVPGWARVPVPLFTEPRVEKSSKRKHESIREGSDSSQKPGKQKKAKRQEVQQEMRQGDAVQLEDAEVEASHDQQELPESDALCSNDQDHIQHREDTPPEENPPRGAKVVYNGRHMRSVMECDENGVPAKSTPVNLSTGPIPTIRDQVGVPIPKNAIIRGEQPLATVLANDPETIKSKQARNPKTRSGYYGRFSKPSPNRSGKVLPPPKTKDQGAYHHRVRSARMPLRSFGFGRPR